MTAFPIDVLMVMIGTTDRVMGSLSLKLIFAENPHSVIRAAAFAENESELPTRRP
jgi:hypothetical protein